MADYSDPEQASTADRIRQKLAQYFTGFNQFQNAVVPHSAGDAANMALYATPGVGTALSANDAYKALTPDASGNRDYRGAALSAIGMVPFIGGMFGGRLAKTADHAALARAGEMQAAGHAPEAIWNETGWFQGADGKWRFEIPDNQAQLGNAETAGVATRFNDINHPELKAAYDPNYQIKGVASPSYPEPQGSYGNGSISVQAPNTGSALSSLLHELQHNVQEREGFALGGRPVSVGDIHQLYEGESNLSKYRRLAGEVEARNVQTRMNMTPEERRATPPWETQDIPFDSQVLRLRDAMMGR